MNIASKISTLLDRMRGFLIRYQLQILVGISILGILFLLFWIPEFQVPSSPALSVKERIELKNAARDNLIKILGGVFLITGAYFTWRQIAIAREGQITERFSKAMEQLGADREGQLFKVLGGIYALERIARDSERDYWSIMEIFTAYLRDRAQWVGRELRPAPDIQAILTVLGRRQRTFKNGEQHRLNLGQVSIGWADLMWAHLEGAHLGGAHLEGANLIEAHLEGAHMGGAHLERAHLRGAHLEGASLSVAHLEGAILNDTHLEGALLGGAHLEGAYLGVAHLEAADLNEAHLEGAFLGGAYLKGAHLGGAHLEGVDLSNTSGLTVEQIAEAITDERTLLPKQLPSVPVQEPKEPFLKDKRLK